MAGLAGGAARCDFGFSAGFLRRAVRRVLAVDSRRWFHRGDPGNCPDVLIRDCDLEHVQRALDGTFPGAQTFRNRIPHWLLRGDSLRLRDMRWTRDRLRSPGLLTQIRNLIMKTTPRTHVAQAFQPEVP